MEQLKNGFYETKVIVTPTEASKIERQTIDQADSDHWINERRKRITVQQSEVKQILYSRFNGNTATNYGTEHEDTARQLYVTYMKANGHCNLTVDRCGLFVSLDNPWLASTPDGLVNDPCDNASQSLGLVEIKNPYAARNLTLDEAMKSPTFLFRM